MSAAVLALSDLLLHFLPLKTSFSSGPSFLLPEAKKYRGGRSVGSVLVGLSFKWRVIHLAASGVRNYA